MFIHTHHFDLICTALPQDAPRESKWNLFNTFQVQQGMSIAQPLRRPSFDASLCDQMILNQNTPSSYLSECKALKQRRKEQLGLQAAHVSGDEDCVIVDLPRCKMKLLQFHSNVRPAYFGTWKKRSTIISARNPFRMDRVSVGLPLIITCVTLLMMTQHFFSYVIFLLAGHAWCGVGVAGCAGLLFQQ